MTLPKPPRRTTQGKQLLTPCINDGCGNRVGGDAIECSSCQEMTRKWENNGNSQAHPRGPRDR